jgi:hypothetical protein
MLQSVIGSNVLCEQQKKKTIKGGVQNPTSNICEILSTKQHFCLLKTKKKKKTENRKKLDCRNLVGIINRRHAEDIER